MGLYFRFSGVIVTSGQMITDCDYTFPQNPDSMSIVTPKSKHTILQTLVGENIYQRTLVDNKVRKMDWSFSNYAVYSGLKRFAVRDAYGEIPVIRFWDGTVYDFQGAFIQVIDVYGVPQVQSDDKWKIELQFKPVTNFDNLKKLI